MSINTSFDIACTSILKQICSFQEREAEWLVDGWIPKGQITLIASDGGVGKTSLWVDIAAAISNRHKQCVLEHGKQYDGEDRPNIVIVISTEDSVSTVLAKKLRLADADTSFIEAPDFSMDVNGEALKQLQFGSFGLAQICEEHKPALIIIDPIQGLVPSGVQMSSRNDMRQALAPLVSLGEKYGTAFLIICHSNKRSGVSGRNRISDSSDLWDLARSVICCGFTDEAGIRYASQEKNNYGRLQKTVLFSIDENGLAQYEGESFKKDADFVCAAAETTSKPKQEDCKALIISKLDEHNGKMKISVLDDEVKRAGYSDITIKRVKSRLKDDGVIKYETVGFGKDKEWYISLKSPNLFDAVPVSWQSDLVTSS